MISYHQLTSGINGGRIEVKSIDEKIVKDYSEMIPNEMREAIQVLSTDQRWAIYNALYFEGQMYFSQIKELFKANSNTLTCALRALMEGGLITRSTDKLEDSFDNNKVFYKVSPMGEMFLTSLFEIVYPDPETKAKVQENTKIFVSANSSPQIVTNNCGGHNRYSQLGIVTNSKVNFVHQKWDKNPTVEGQSRASFNGVR